MLRQFLSRIGTRVFVPFTVLLVAVTALYGVAGLQLAERHILGGAADELRVLSVVLSRQVQNVLGRIGDSLKSMETHGTLVVELKKKDPDQAIIEEFLRARLASSPLFVGLALFDTHGKCVGSTDLRWYDEINGKTKPFFLDGMKAFNFSDIFTSDEGKMQLVSTPVGDGVKTRGVLVGQVNLSAVYDLMDQKLGVEDDTTDAFLLDSALRFITPGKTGEDRLLESHLLSTNLIKHLKEEFWVDRYRNYAGDTVLGTVMKIPGSHWYVAVERDMDEIKEPLAQARWLAVGTTAAMIIALVITSFLLSRSITRPLTTLVQSTRRIAMGDFSTPIPPPRSSDEIAFLAREVERMRARIADYQRGLEERLEESERKRLESERLAAIGTLASSLAHEIRNPLNAMSLLLSRLELSAQRGTNEAPEQGVIVSLRTEISRLDRLVSDILDYARPLTLNYADFDLKELVAGTLSMYRGLFEEKGVRAVADLPNVRIPMRADADRVKQCLLNLLQNAVDAVPRGGTVEVALAADDRQATVTVRDDGVGLPDGSASRVFDLFFTTKERGTGLGLSTVKKIVDAHYGHVTLSRRPLTGTEVVLDLPRNSQI